MHWHKMQCSGSIPTARYGHTAHIVGSRMFIFGGRGVSGSVFSDLFFLDLVQWVWVPVSPLSPGPGPRLHHSSVLVGRKIVVHGGWTGSHLYADLWVFDTDSFSWLQPRTGGFAPSARRGHSLSLLTDGRLLLFGGGALDSDHCTPCYCNDLRTLDTDTMIWTRPKVLGVLPTGRFGHSATLLDNNTKLVIYGGWGKGGVQTKEMINNPKAESVHVLDIANLTWYVPNYDIKKTVKHLFFHANASSSDSNSVLIFGGSDGRQSTNGFIVLNFDFPQNNEDNIQYDNEQQYESYNNEFQQNLNQNYDDNNNNNNDYGY